jgi:hypothetical protein
MGFASLRFRRSVATRWKIRLFLRPCRDKRSRTGIGSRSIQCSSELFASALVLLHVIRIRGQVNECLRRRLLGHIIYKIMGTSTNGRLLARYYHWLLATTPLVRRSREPTKKENIGDRKLDGAMDERARTMHMLFPFRSVCASFVDLRPLGVISLRTS